MIPDLKMIRGELWLDFKENWQGWLKFVLWEIPRDILHDIVEARK